MGHGAAAGRRLRRLPRRLPDRLGQPTPWPLRDAGRDAARRPVRRVDGRRRTTRRRASPTAPTCGGFLVVWYDTARQPERRTRCGAASSATGRRRPALHRAATSSSALPPAAATASWGIDVSYTYASRRFLVAYNQIGPPTPTSSRSWSTRPATLVGGPQPLSLDNHWQREPSIAYDTRNDNFMVAWGIYYNPGRPRAPCTCAPCRPRPARSAPVREVATGSAVYVPQVEYQRRQRPVLRRLVHAAERLGAHPRARWHAGRRHVAPGLQLRDLRRARPGLQPGREHLLRRLPRPRRRGRRRPGVGGRRARRRVRR